MSCNCCSSAHEPPRRAPCPGCGEPGEAVTTTTLLHQLATPWQQRIADEPHYFCNQSACPVVYFDNAGQRFDSTALRQAVGQKSTAPGRTLCYCFDIRYSDLSDEARARQCREFVLAQTRHKVCACEERNPSGHCCLRDFPKERSKP